MISWVDQGMFNLDEMSEKGTGGDRPAVRTQQSEESMSDPTPEEALDELRHRAERDQFNLSLRFELARRLYHSGNYSEAIPHLQTASRDPGLRREVYKLLGQTFEGLGMDDPADAILREIEDLAGDDIPDDDPPEDERPPDAGVRAPLKPDSPKSDAAAKKFPPDDEGKGLTN